MNSKQSPTDDKATLRQSIKDDVEIAMILLKQYEEKGFIKKLT